MPTSSPAQAADHSRLFPVLIVLIGIAVYSTSFGGVFVFDDENNIIDNPQIRSFPAAGVRITQLRCLLIESLALNYALGGLDVFGYHVFNLSVHLLAGLVLYGLVRRVLHLEPADSGFRRHRDGLACAIALLWVVHPLQTQSVTYLIQRGEALMGLFYLLSLYCVLRGATSAAPGWPWYLAALVATALGMTSKEVMVTAPLVILIFDRIFLAPSVREVVRQRGGLYLLLFSPLLLLGPILPMLFEENLTRVGLVSAGTTPWQYLRSQPEVILYYLKLACFPFPLCLDHGWPIADNATTIALTSLLVLGLLAATGWALWRQPRLGFLGLTFFLILAPTSSVVPVSDLCVEHRMYLPLAPVLVLLVLAGHWGLARLARRFGWSELALRRRELALLACLVAVFGALTLLRNRDYQSSLTMWLAVLDMYPQHARAHNNAAQAYRDLGDAVLADRHYRRAIALDPGSAVFRFGYAVLLANVGELRGAEEQVRAGLRLDPAHAPGYAILGAILARGGHAEEAVAALREAVQRAPDLPDARVHLGLALEQLGRDDEAETSYRQALLTEPHGIKPNRHFGNLLVQRGRAEEALAPLRRVVEADPDDLIAHTDLARALMALGHTSAAQIQFDEAFRLQANWPRRHAAVAWKSATHGRAELRDARQALRLAEAACQGTQHADPLLLDVLAAAYAENERFADAVRTARQAHTRAQAAGLTALAQQIEGRLRLYEKNLPFRDASLAAAG